MVMNTAETEGNNLKVQGNKQTVKKLKGEPL